MYRGSVICWLSWSPKTPDGGGVKRDGVGLEGTARVPSGETMLYARSSVLLPALVALKAVGASAAFLRLKYSVGLGYLLAKLPLAKFVVPVTVQ